MELKALSHYNGDKNTRYGDCILLYDESNLIVYDCGHAKHAEAVKKFLEEQEKIIKVNIVISHNDSDHTDGILDLLGYLNDQNYEVTIYTSLYLKSVKEVEKNLDDGRRTKKSICEHILELFDHIAEIVTVAEEYGFCVENALPDTKVVSGVIVGPKEAEFADVVTKAIEGDGTGNINGETVMNAASIQLKCTLNNGKTVLLCGDASPSYIHNLEMYNIIQLPHHGNLDDAERIFDKIEDPYSKDYLISDNTGSGDTSGGSDNLVKKMKDEKFSPAYNTKNGIVVLPKENCQVTNGYTTQGVRLGALDCKC